MNIEHIAMYVDNLEKTRDFFVKYFNASSNKGSYFQGRKTDGRWNRYIVPFSIIGAVTPKFVSKITDWAVNGTNAVKIEWNGKDIII